MFSDPSGVHCHLVCFPFPVACSGHAAVLVGKVLVVYGGLYDKIFLHDTVVLDLSE